MKKGRSMHAVAASDRYRIAADYLDGHSLHDIAERYGVEGGRNQVRRIAMLFKLPRRRYPSFAEITEVRKSPGRPRKPRQDEARLEQFAQ